ncbi:DUF3307 domain-containing protein [Actinomadura graeca]|uniref:DUF3307 domain-containing protein n=1 Tax=Actinomadura graeca TaxID=2750812 RepID=A0ABX8QZM0_9ACTN|nr:hypothetical protein [Actinomadura graeca]QXJ24254.1 DUF3307 domain-containing protein [Actinomadura graeca]
MARGKKTSWWPAVAHGLAYTLPFAALTRSPLALLVIGGTHIVIDRFQMARHVGWARDHLAPRGAWPDRAALGVRAEGKEHAIEIVADNTMHLLINTAALTWLA